MEWIEKKQLLEELFIHRRDAIAIHRNGHWTGRAKKWKRTENNRYEIEEYLAYTPENGDPILYHHAEEGSERIGIYPHALDNSTKTITADFDDKKNTNNELFSTCLLLKQVLCSNGIQAYIERSHSGFGFHLWIFFEHPVDCDLATKVMVEAFKQAGLPMSVGANGYDRLFPCTTKVGKNKNDKKPWVGNIIGLPLQATAASRGNCVFLNDFGAVVEDQWNFLKCIQKTSEQTIFNFTKSTSQLQMPVPKPVVIEETSGWEYWRALSHIPGQYERMMKCKAIKEHILRPNMFDNRQWALGIIGNIAVYTANNDLEDDVIKFAYEIEKDYIPKTGAADTTEQTLMARKDHLQMGQYPMSCKEMFATSTSWTCPELETCPFNFIAKYNAPISFTIYSSDRPIAVQERVRLNQLEQYGLYDIYRKILPWGDNIPDYLIARHLLGISPLHVETYNKKDNTVKSIFQEFSSKTEADIFEQMLVDVGLGVYLRYNNSFWLLSVVEKHRNNGLKLVANLLSQAGIQTDQNFSNISISNFGLFQNERAIAPFFDDITGCEQQISILSKEGKNDEH